MLSKLEPTPTQVQAQAILDELVRTRVPGVQYIVTDANHTLHEYAGGWAEIQNQHPMTLDTTMMAYSMTKTLTAAAVLQLVERGTIGLEHELDHYVPENPYHAHITLRQLLDHTSGIPNPIPLRWVHLATNDALFDENAALDKVMREHPKLDFAPGAKYAYSNIGYWLLGHVIAQASGTPYKDYMRANVLGPLNLSADEMDFVITNPAQHANGYLAKWSAINFLKPLLTDSEVWGGYEGNWLRLKNHNSNGPSFGGLVGTARAFGRFLQDQLGTTSVLFDSATKQLFETPQTDARGEPIPMTLGWHIGETNGENYFFKEGGGGGFHSEMRIYPARSIGTVIMANDTELNSTKLLDQLDGIFLVSKI